MFCEDCGIQLPDDSAFCSECGSKISFAGNETRINEENFNFKKESSPKEQRGLVPPVMRQKLPQRPSEPYKKETMPRQPSEPNRGEAVPLKTPRQPSEPYRRETGLRQPSESYVSAAADIIGLGQYILMIFLAGIPIINIILLIKWGFFNKQSPNKSNFAKALLFYYLIAVLIYVAYIWLWLKATSSI